LKYAALLVILVVLVSACTTPSGGGTQAPRPLQEPTQTLVPWKPVGNAVTVAGAARLAQVGSLNAHTATVNRFAFAHRNRWLLSQDGTGQVVDWDLETGRKKYSLSGAGAILLTYFSSDDSRVVTVGLDRQIRTWDASTGSNQSAVSGDPSNVSSAVALADGSGLAVGNNDGGISLWRPPSRSPALRLQGTSSLTVQLLAFRPDGTQLAAATSDGAVTLWDMVQGTALTRLDPFPNPVSQLDFSADGKMLAAASGQDVYLLSGADFKTRRKLSEPGMDAQRGISLSPDSSLLAVSSQNALVYIWDVFKGALLVKLPGHDGQISGLTWSPDSALFISIVYSPRGGAFLWKTDSFRGPLDQVQRAQIALAVEHIYVAQWSPDGRLLVGADSRGPIVLWGIPAS
jgi:WD40 repeat protein